MLCVSTSWVSEHAFKAKEVLYPILDLNVNCCELDFRIHQNEYEELCSLIKKEGVKILSVHNFCPAPETVQKLSADAFSFASEDAQERELAVKYTIRTIENAVALEAKAVVLHLGWIPLQEKADLLYELYERGELESPLGQAAKENLQQERLLRQPAYIDRVLLVLDKILNKAYHLGISLGIENRYHYHDIPTFEEIGLILEKFAGAPLGYWHDTGHAYHWELMGWAKQNDFLSTYHEQLLGIHLHDARGREDHFAPGMGDIDFQSLKDFLKPDVLRVCEAHSKASRADYLAGIEMLKKLGF